jgi:iron(III) transport system substrate-binding protein
MFGGLYTSCVAPLPCGLVRRLPLLLVLVLLGAALTGCGGSSGDRLTIYSGRTKNLIGPLLDRFHEETGIRIAVRYGDSAELALLIDQEGDDTPADVFLSQSPGALGYLVDRYEPLPERVLDLVDERFRDDRGRWVGLSGRVRVLVYNTDLVEPGDLPASVFDLTDQAFRGRVAVAPTNGSFQDFVTAMRAGVGDDRTLAWLEGLVDNDSPTYANNNAIVDAVASGEVPMGLVNHYYNERQLQEDPRSPSRNHLFEDGDLGSLVLVSGVAVLRGTDRADEAARLVEFLLSEASQQFFAAETFEYPLAEGVPPAIDDLPPLADIAAPRVDLDSLGGGLGRTLRLIRDSGLESS